MEQKWERNSAAALPGAILGAALGADACWQWRGLATYR